MYSPTTGEKNEAHQEDTIAHTSNECTDQTVVDVGMTPNPAYESVTAGMMTQNPAYESVTGIQPQETATV